MSQLSEIINTNSHETYLQQICPIHDKHRNLKQTRELMEKKELHMSSAATRTRLSLIINNHSLKRVISQPCLQVLLSFV